MTEPSEVLAALSEEIIRLVVRIPETLPSHAYSLSLNSERGRPAVELEVSGLSKAVRENVTLIRPSTHRDTPRHGGREGQRDNETADVAT